MADFTEVADRVWVTQPGRSDLNVTVVAGADGLGVVDPGPSADLVRALVEDVRRLGGPVRYVVSTHHHAAHTAGNAVLAAAGAQLVGHENAPLSRRDRTFSSVTMLDLGERVLELVHPGRGHTAGDCVVRVPDADVVIAGDVLHEAGGGVPVFGEDCWPLEWPLALDMVLNLVLPTTTVVPGHGSPVGRDFVEEQRNQIGLVAGIIGRLAGQGVPVEQALAAADDWPYPRERLATAVRRGYEQLPRGARQLPLA